jgi:hypothetical protein
MGSVEDAASVLILDAGSILYEPSELLLTAL